MCKHLNTIYGLALCSARGRMMQSGHYLAGPWSLPPELDIMIRKKHVLILIKFKISIFQFTT